MKILKINHLIILIILISGCSSIPKNTSNSCSIFNERYLWFKHASKSEKKWGTPVYLQLAIIKMESDFDWLAKPPRQKLFKVIPYKRPSSSFGYLKLLMVLGNNIKKKQEINLQSELGLKIVLILSVGTQVNLVPF